MNLVLQGLNQGSSTKGSGTGKDAEGSRSGTYAAKEAFQKLSNGGGELPWWGEEGGELEGKGPQGFRLAAVEELQPL